MDSSSMTISPASSADLAAMVKIQRLAYSSEAVAPFFFSDFPNPTTMNNYFEIRIKERLTNPWARTWKVTEIATDEIMGFVSWTYL